MRYELLRSSSKPAASSRDDLAKCLHQHREHFNGASEVSNETEWGTSGDAEELEESMYEDSDEDTLPVANLVPSASSA